MKKSPLVEDVKWALESKHGLHVSNHCMPGGGVFPPGHPHLSFAIESLSVSIYIKWGTVVKPLLQDLREKWTDKQTGSGAYVFSVSSVEEAMTCIRILTEAISIKK